MFTGSKGLFYLCILLVVGRASAVVTSGSEQASETTNWDGVGALVSQSQTYSSASGVLIDSTHLLTAAHAVYDIANQATVAPSSFLFQIGSESYAIKSIAIPTGYSSSNPSYEDLAVVTLTAPATGHTTYGYNTGSITETSANTILVGYGIGGSPSANASQYPFGTKCAAANAVDLNTDDTAFTPKQSVGQLPTGLIVYDYDNPSDTSTNKTGGGAITYFGIPEGDTADGDSGGPMFQLDPNTGDWLVTGITSDGTSKNSKYGDISWGTRVSDYSSFIASEVPEPGTLTFFGSTALLLCRSSRARKP